MDVNEDRQRKNRASSFDYREEFANERALRNEMKMKHLKKQRRIQRKKKRQRGCLFSLLMVAVIAVLVFFTPIFNIRYVTIEGNDKVSMEAISEAIGDLRGKNLFKTSIRSVKEDLSTIVYLNEISVTRKYLPPALAIHVTEHMGAGCIDTDTDVLIIASDGKIVERTNEISDEVPHILNCGEYTEVDGYYILTDSEKQEVMTEILAIMEKLDLIADVDNVDIGDLNNITFRYQDRIYAECGSDIDMERKIRLFKKAVTTSELADNEQGTMDLSTSGKCVYSSEIKE